jgi:hypothetical protein
MSLRGAATGTSSSLYAGVTQIYLDRNASLSHTYIQSLDSANTSSSASGSAMFRHCEVLQSELQMGAAHEIFVLQQGASISRLNVHVDLLGHGANTTVSAL